jgi:signal transduction histidine kinase
VVVVNPVKSWKKERLGLFMIAASLAVIMLICALLVADYRISRETRIRQEGTALARLLAELPLEELVPDGGRRGVVHALAYGLRDTSLAYAVIVNPAGSPLLEVSSPGRMVPVATMPAEPSVWLEEVTLDLDGQPLMEFRAPIYSGGEVAAYVRLGYLAPTLGVTRDQLPFLATIALAVFLLTPGFYFLLKREVKPLRELCAEMETAIGFDQAQQIEREANDALDGILNAFTQFVERSRRRIEDLEEHLGDLDTSSKLIGYQRSRIEAVIQSLPEAILVLDEAGVTVFANNKLSSLIGIDPASVVGKYPSEWDVEGDFLVHLGKCQSKGCRGYAGEAVEYAPTNAPEKTIALTAYPLFARDRDGGAAGGMVVACRDVTLESMAKKARGEFIAHVAHELKSPLNVLRMYSEELLRTDDLPEEFRIEAVNVIYDEVDRLSTLISNLLSLTKIEMGSLTVDRQRVKLNDLLEDALNTVARSGHGEDLQIRLRVPRELSPVAVDKDLLRVAINNLLTNAIKYNRPGGEVTLSAEESDEAICIAVKDTGIGIRDGDVGRIFDKFFRSDEESVRTKGGHGLGLPLARQIIELHHGTLSVSSIPGEGSEFVITLKKEAGLVKQAI